MSVYVDQLHVFGEQTDDGPVSASFRVEPAIPFEGRGGELERVARLALDASGVVATEQTGRKE